MGLEGGVGVGLPLFVTHTDSVGLWKASLKARNREMNGWVQIFLAENVLSSLVKYQNMDNLEEVGGGSGNGVKFLTAACPKAFYSSLGSVYWLGGFSLMLQSKRKKAEKTM